jgi:uncharacterized SAM-binding protein YcdF (DUF218 family)
VILALGGLLAGTFLWLRGTADAVYAYQDTVDGVHLPEVDAIVCLAGGRGRISAAGDLWYRYWEQDLSRSSIPGPPRKSARPILYFSGVGAPSTWKSVRSQLRSGVMQVIEPRDVILENQSTSTEENALWLLQYARERNWKSFLIVTSRYHMRRARLIFERLFEKERQLRTVLRPADAAPLEPIRIETLSVYQEPFEPGEWADDVHGVRVTLGEFFKWIYYAHLWNPRLGSEAPGVPAGAVSPSPAVSSLPNSTPAR